MNNNLNPQAPANQSQVPDHRLDEMSKQIKELRDQNQQLRGTVDYMSKSQQGQGQQQPQQQSPFKPEVQQAIDEIVQQKVQGLQTEFRQQVGMLVDQNDELKYHQLYGGEKFKKYHDKVEETRREYQARGQYIPREEALKKVYFDETGRKAQTEEPKQEAQAQPQPQWSPYFGAYVDPQTGKPVQGVPMDQSQQKEEPQTPPWQTQQAPPQGPQQPGYPQGQQGQPAPQQTMPTGFEQSNHSYHPHANPFGQAPALPGEGVNDPTPAQRGPAGPVEIDLNSSDSDLQAFENQFGDIPL